MGKARDAVNPEIQNLADANLLEAVREHARWQAPCTCVEEGGVLLMAGANAFPGVFRNCVVRVDERVPADRLLQHGRRRVVYGVELIANATEYLLGFERTPRYLYPLDRPDDGVADIAAFWWRRWAEPRVKRPDVRAAVASHTLVLPVRHGARVVLPPEDPTQLDLFASLGE